MNYPLISAELERMHFMAEPEAFKAWLRAMAPRIYGESVVINMNDNQRPATHAGMIGEPIKDAVDEWGQKIFRPVRMLPGTGVGVLEIEGSLIHKGKFAGTYCGNTSYEWIEAAANEARENEAVKAVIFEVDCFGGVVDGAFSCAAALARLAAAKPTMAVIKDNACSAGYLLACQSGWLSMSPTGLTGSVGVNSMHVDYSQAVEKAGIVITPIFSGEHKNDFSPFEPLPDEVLQKQLARVNKERAGFAQVVAAARGERCSYDAVMATEADTFPAEEALALGLVDSVEFHFEATEQFISKFG